MAVQIGPKIGIEGEKEYRQQISQIIAQTKQLDSAMEATAATWTQNTSAMQKNRSIAQNLTQQIALQEEKIQTMNSLLEASAQKYGENATQTQRWKTAINDANANLATMKQQLGGLGNAAGFSDLSVKIANVGTQMQTLGASMQSVGQKLTTSLTLPIAAAGGAAVKLASDLTESSNKVDVVFGSMSQSVKDFAASTTDMYAISEGKALEMASDYGAMATSMGLSQQQAAQLAMEMTGLAGDMASFHNKSVDIAANSLRGVFTGEAESLKQFGVAMTETNLEEFAKQHGQVYSQMSQGEKILTRYQYLMESQSDAMGDASRTMGDFAGSTRHLKAALQDAGAALGEAILPMITPLIEMLTSLAKWFSNLPAPVQKFLAVVLLLAAAFGPVIMILGTFISALGTVTAAMPGVIAALVKLATAIVGVEVSAAPAIAIILGIAVAIGVVIAAASALGTAIGENWDSIAASASNMGDKVQGAVSKILQFREALKTLGANALDSLIQQFKEFPNKVVHALREAIDGVKQTFDQMIANAKKSGSDFVEGFVDGLKQKLSKVIEAVKKIANTIKDFLGFSCPDKGPLHEYETWMPDFMMGLAKGIRGSMGYVKGAIGDVAKTMSLPLDSNATMNMAYAGADGGSIGMFGGTTMNVYVDHISELSDLVRIQNQAQQMMRMGAR